MAYSFVVYTGNGSQTDFVVPFAYLTKSHIHVYLAGVEQMSGWSWFDSTTVRFSSAPANGATVLIRRKSSPGLKMITFIDGSQATAADFNLDSLQDFYLCQEATDLTALSISLNEALAAFDGLGYRLSNIAAPAGDGDAVNRLYLQQYVTALGNVPAPANPADDTKILQASGGTFTWQSVAAVIQGLSDMVIASADGGAGAAPILRLQRNSASPAVSDTLGVINYEARNTSAAVWTAAQIYASVISPTAGAESAYINFNTTQSGSITRSAFIGAGVGVGIVSDPGAGGVNVSGKYYVNGVALACNRMYDSGNQSWTQGGLLTLTHGLGARPLFIQLSLEAAVVNNGYGIGYITYVNCSGDFDAGAVPDRAVGIVADAGSIYIRCPLSGFTIGNFATGAYGRALATQWVLRVMAWSQ